jgi:hypothetical protein
VQECELNEVVADSAAFLVAGRQVRAGEGSVHWQLETRRPLVFRRQVSAKVFRPKSSSEAVEKIKTHPNAGLHALRHTFLTQAGEYTDPLRCSMSLATSVSRNISEDPPSKSAIATPHATIIHASFPKLLLRISERQHSRS